MIHLDGPYRPGGDRDRWLLMACLFVACATYTVLRCAAGLR